MTKSSTSYAVDYQGNLSLGLSDEKPTKLNAKRNPLEDFSSFDSPDPISTQQLKRMLNHHWQQK